MKSSAQHYFEDNASLCIQSSEPATADSSSDHAEIGCKQRNLLDDSEVCLYVRTQVPEWLDNSVKIVKGLNMYKSH
uniref:AlNc14C84G5429 protein n=1 Tax=Albugo laibachii Nc14 TaxID=890382 RepID=F0WFP5_9STRA|nr:AlNc14C84G5429 [Albugo laibachii Nc14]|eukprot:CCA20027.1 AlNc14C84G5429 [Albugo laibachii Nc14]